MENIAIETGILPPAKGGSRKYPLENMQVGDSFLVPAVNQWQSVYLSVSASARRCSKRTSAEFKVAKITQEQLEISPQLDPNKKGVGVRCWRVK
jgi:hypothetical protein